MTMVTSQSNAASMIDLAWDQKYRPQTLADMALTEENRRLLEGYLEDGIFPHLLLHGPPGVGKTTAAEILIDSTACRRLNLNASSDRGLDTIRGQVLRFIRTHGFGGEAWRVVFLDEADGLTPDAANALRNPMETYADCARFILTANAVDKVSDAIRSRCVEIHMEAVPVEERARVLARVLEFEAVEAADSQIRWFAARHPDLRRMLLAAQQSLQVHGELRIEVRSDATCQLLAEIIAEPEYSVDVRWDLRPYTAPGRLTLLSARPKLGKSTFAAHYAAKKVLGDEFVGQLLEAGPVLWVSGPEENKYDIARRFEELGVEQEKVWVYTGLSDMHAIAAKAAEIGARLVVLDTLARIAGVRSENDNAAWVRWSNMALSVIRESGISWLAIHHTRKPGWKDDDEAGVAIRGASAIFGLVDIALSLRPGYGCNQRRLVVDGTRFESPGHGLLIELEDGEYFVAGYEPQEADQGHHIPGAALSVLEDLKEAAEPISRVDFAQRLEEKGDEVSLPTLYEFLNMLLAAGRVRRLGKGVKGDPHLWEAIEEDSSDSFDDPGFQTQQNESAPESEVDPEAHGEEPGGD